MHKTSAKNDPYYLALTHVEAVKASDALIEEELDKVRPDHRRVASLNAKLGIALKLADVYASLAVADATRGRGDVELLVGGGAAYCDAPPTRSGR